MELPTLTTSGLWKSSRMPAKCTERHAAWRGAVTRYYQERWHVTGSCRHRGFESITVGHAALYYKPSSGWCPFRWDHIGIVDDYELVKYHARFPNFQERSPRIGCFLMINRFRLLDPLLLLAPQSLMHLREKSA